MIANKAIDDFRANMPDILRNLGGKPLSETKRMSAKWSFEDGKTLKVENGIDMAAEILSALSTEFKAETTLGIFREAISVAPVAKHFENISASLEAPVGERSIDFVSAVFDNAENSFGTCTIIMSPAHFTLMYCAVGSDIDEEQDLVFVRCEESATNNMVGHLGKHKVIIDPYAPESSPTLICAEGWFTYSASNYLSATQIVNLQTKENTVVFDSDLKCDIDPTKVACVSVKEYGFI